MSTECKTPPMEMIEVTLWKDVPKELARRCDDVDALCERVSGELVSRQVLAVIVEQWRRDVIVSKRIDDKIAEIRRATESGSDEEC